MQHEKSKRIELARIPVFAGPEGATGFYRFDSYLAEKTHTALEPLHKLRLQEIDSMLRRYKIERVCEMGSGRTTYFFNLYPGLHVVSYEQDERWKKTILAYYEEAGLPPPDIVCSPVEHYKHGGRFARFQNVKCDLLYIDGPYVAPAPDNGTRQMGKPVYYDFERVFEVCLPKIIMVEGRTTTVDELLATSHITKYKFHGELT
jgi:hypothetical protein